MNAASDLACHVGVQPACAALGVSRASYYRRQRNALCLSGTVNADRPRPPLALLDSERQTVLDTLHC